ncbi:uncharacterized protein LACBIDRAFT_331510 [Laccaria bicolor S238N-H82]|uniref:Predicted protein n=1 Tax=Laccaria bicolor (strain S238N-H82 / ATCC MYA-4686) TaxID=486041 RepID=B0DPP3_LACBS|nr:uncharacterized protein LACBIDRAFT_331510 [Laccaria bicolor S238N-H82]EDR03412.1 predicted protein [Laccaria bicolor S238N-H82]|eukprot:XP_001885868.1 predicted protein [Laccaria bicolor S238N-H82]
MSHKWTANAYGELSEQAMRATCSEIKIYPWTISHDNVNIPLRVFSQQLNNQSHFISGCTATVWILLHFRVSQATSVFSFDDVMYGEPDVDACIESQHQYHILWILLDCPEFSDYPHHDDPLLAAPPPVHELEAGLENATKQFILGTCPIEEASYEGTLKVMEEWFKQLHLDSEDEKMKTGLKLIIAWISDQLMIERLRGLWKYRHEDHNAFDRMDFMIPIFGWFHLIMALANSLHKQYLGMSAGIGGLQHAFDSVK